MSIKRVVFVGLVCLVMLAAVGIQAAYAAEDVPPGFPCKEEYFVRSGDTLTTIADMSGTPALVLVKINNLNRPEFLFPGQKLCVKYYVAAGDFYGVRSGDTLTQVANQYDKDMEFIASVNNLEDDVVYAGQILFIPRNRKYFK